MAIETDTQKTGLQSFTKQQYSRVQSWPEQNWITVKPWGLPIGRATTLNQTWAIGINMPIPFEAIQIGYVHVGGYGDCTGIKACVAGTDDIGPCDFSAGGADLTFKKFVTPWVGGTEYNTLSTPGWTAVTWSGAASASVTDPGANLIDVAWSDVIQLPSYVDSRNSTGWYAAIARVYPGAGPCTYGGKAGWTTATQYNSELGPAKLVGAIRSGDCVTDPTTWTKSLTATITDTPTAPLIVRVFGANTRSKSIMFVGDSRFDTVTESPYDTSQGYRSFSYMVEAKLATAGRKHRVIKSAIGGATSATYYQQATELLTACSPDVAVYIGYTINDGTPTDAIMQTARYRTLLFLQRCKTLGTVPVIFTAFPRGGMTAGNMVYLSAFETWVQSLGVRWFSPLQRYGNADGTWKTGVSTDGTNHMTQAAYETMADDFIATFNDIL
jgi:hypothetical protein